MKVGSEVIKKLSLMLNFVVLIGTAYTEDIEYTVKKQVMTELYGYTGPPIKIGES